MMKRSVRRIGRQIGLARPAGGNGSEVAASWYDDAYRRIGSYQEPFYLSPYYALWTVIADRLHQYGARHILDVGCGPGQFADLIRDWGFERYTGLDFSDQAIEMARRRVPGFEFFVADARSPDSYRRIDYDAIVCTEVLEHVQDDFGVIGCFAGGVRCLCTVPNFPFSSHVRHFRTSDEVRDRYGAFFDSLTITRLKGTRDAQEQFFLFDGVRNSHVSQADRSEVTA